MKQISRTRLLQKDDKKRFNKNLVIPVEDGRSSISSNKCWICNKLFVEEENIVRDNDPVTEKYRKSAHWNCNILN